MTQENAQYDRICKGEFAELHRKLDRLDETLRGNGEVGLKTRIDRLERSDALRNRLLWLLTASAVAGSMSLFGHLVLLWLKGIS